MEQFLPMDRRHLAKHTLWRYGSLQVLILKLIAYCSHKYIAFMSSQFAGESP